MSEYNKRKELIDRVKEIKRNREELINFTRLCKETTGFPCDVWVDTCKSYEEFKHEPCIYADDGGILIPITLGEKPCVKKIVSPKWLDLSEIVKFVSKYYTFLKDVADEKYGTFDVHSLVDYQSNAGTLTEDINFNIIKSTLKPNETGLPTSIWVDENETFMGHAPRIKIRASHSSKSTYNDPSMEIMDPTRIHNFPKDSFLSKKDIEKIQTFVRKYQKELMALAKKEMVIGTFKSILMKPDEVVDLINSTYGISLYKIGDKYNYKNENGDYILHTNVDDAKPFININGDLVAWILLGKQWFTIDQYGNRIDL